MVLNSVSADLPEGFDPLGEILWGADPEVPRAATAAWTARGGPRPRRRHSVAPEEHPALLLLDAVGRQYPHLSVEDALPLITLATGAATPRLGRFSLPRVRQA